MTLEEYFGDWIKVINKEELQKIMNVLDNRYKTNDVYPLKKDIFKSFEALRLEDLNSVLLTGIYWEDELNLFKNVYDDYIYLPSFSNFEKTLGKAGTLVLSAALTKESDYCFHKELWRPFIKSLLINLSKHNTGIVYTLINAKEYAKYINKRFNHILLQEQLSLDIITEAHNLVTGIYGQIKN